MNEWQDLTEKELEEISKYYGPMSEGEWNLMLVAQEALRKKNTNQEPKKPIAYINLDKKCLEFAAPFQFNRSCFKQGKVPLYLGITEEE